MLIILGRQSKYFIVLQSGFTKSSVKQVCSSGGTGRRAGFKIQCFRTCGFDSHLEYERESRDLCLGFFISGTT